PDRGDDAALSGHRHEGCPAAANAGARRCPEGRSQQLEVSDHRRRERQALLPLRGSPAEDARILWGKGGCKGDWHWPQPWRRGRAHCRGMAWRHSRARGTASPALTFTKLLPAYSSVPEALY